MNYRIETVPPFDRAVKRLARKYRHLKADLETLVSLLRNSPNAGVAIPGYAHTVWKIRLASTDMQAGKRGAYRVIYAVDVERRRCILLFIYARADQTDISAAEIDALLAELDEQT